MDIRHIYACSARDMGVQHCEFKKEKKKKGESLETELRNGNPKTCARSAKRNAQCNVTGFATWGLTTVLHGQHVLSRRCSNFYVMIHGTLHRRRRQILLGKRVHSSLNPPSARRCTRSKCLIGQPCCLKSSFGYLS